MEIRKTAVFAKMMRGPAGNPESSEARIPTKDDKMPMAVAPTVY
jgi:hypothetical protein